MFWVQFLLLFFELIFVICAGLQNYYVNVGISLYITNHIIKYHIIKGTPLKKSAFHFSHSV